MTHLAVTPIATETGTIPMVQGRLLGGTSAVNAMATLRVLPDDYDAWTEAVLEGQCLISMARHEGFGS